VIVQEVAHPSTDRKQLTINIYKTNFASESVAIAPDTTAPEAEEEIDEDDRARIEFNNAVESIGFDHQGEFYPIEFAPEDYEWTEIGRCMIATAENYTAILNYSLMEYWEVHHNTIEILEMAIAEVSRLEGVVNTEATHQVLDLGNNESLSTGIFEDSNGTFDALTLTESKSFKTRKGAIKWLAVRGYAPNGKKL